MEKKIEISEPKCISAVKWYRCETKVDGVYTTVSYGNTPEEAQANARIAASGYLVEELVDMLSEAKLQIEYLHDNYTMKGFGTGSGKAVLSRIETLITKATDTK